MTIFQESIDDIYSTITNYFSILDYYYEDDRYIFRISSYPEDFKNRFISLYREMKNKFSLLPIITRDETGLIINVLPFKTPERENISTPIVLLAVTLVTVFLDGYIRSFSPVYFDVIRGYDPLFTTILFSISIMGIIGIHELGHKLALYIHNIKASWPRFIPGIPSFLPTLGALISQREPPANRDTLFDIGISGPIAGLIVTIVVSIYASLTAPIITVDELAILESKYGESGIMPVPPLYRIIQLMVKPPTYDGVIIVTPLMWVAIVGFLITGLNLLPAWQLDGGHLARAAVGEKYHFILTLLSIMMLFLTGYWLMAMLILFLALMSGGRGARPLDDVSDLSPKRKVLFVFSLVLAFLCLPNMLI